MLFANYNLGPVGFGRSTSPGPGLVKSSADVLFVVSNALSSVEQEVAVRLRTAIRPRVRIDFFMVVIFLVMMYFFNIQFLATRLRLPFVSEAKLITKRFETLLF